MSNRAENRLRDEGNTHLMLGNSYGNVRSLEAWLSNSSEANSGPMLSWPWRRRMVCVCVVLGSIVWVEGLVIFGCEDCDSRVLVIGLSLSEA